MPPTPLSDVPATDPAEVRRRMTAFLRSELVGPDPGLPAVQLNGEEILRPQDPPRLRYSAGVLFPLQVNIQTQIEADREEVELAEAVEFDEDEMEGVDEAAEMGQGREDGGENDQDVNLANEYLPSAMGLSALVDLPDRLTVRIEAARYEKEEIPGAGWTNAEGRYVPYVAHWRIPLDAELVLTREQLSGPEAVPLNLPVTAGGSDEGEGDDASAVGSEGLHLHVLSRPYAGDDGRELRLITFTLVNRKEARGGRPQDDECFFQCGFTVTSDDACFLEYPERPEAPTDDEEASLRLLYRHRKVFAVGHGCAPEWGEETAVGQEQRASSVQTATLPTYDVKPIVPSALDGIELSMRALSDSERSDAIGLCQALADAYRAWIEGEESRIDAEVPEHLQDAAWAHMESCRECLRRIEDGIDLLGDNATVRMAFALMNRSMLMQQIHYGLSSETTSIRKWVRQGRQLELERPFAPPDYDAPDTWGVARPERLGRWRPFQLAFVLMNLRSVADPACDEREVVDLIWFPTGGGKTEAYLGLTAFTILLRRLKRPSNAGTTVLMRYTLRLLTAQQYQRAASLICALDQLRRSEPKALGETPITAGLWVGGEVTPNREEQAVAAFDRMYEGRDRDNPFVLLSCPWCGAQMGPVTNGRRTECKGYRKLRRPTRIRFVCDDADCAFSGDEGLPLQVVDTAIYDEPPTLVIGTVDKFAMLPWRPESRALFGIDQEGYDPPDLIVQDELHLISGPLGSMVGHYETVMDLLCERNHDGGRVGAKIVASTATISRAAEQITSLYGRSRDDVLLFPPQGLRAGESFFAYEDDQAEGRTYVGVFASALPSHVTAQIRVLSSLLQGVRVGEADEEMRDPYWTLMVYFNSLRELGHAATLVRADIREYLNAMWDRLGLTRRIGGEEAAARRRFINHALELTSRIHSSRIPETLLELFTGVHEDGNRPVDVCLATNMIQVGLDVPRLSLMAVVGQPKTMSEYIQATSRVGRRYPGLVVTVYNPARPRDRSHYEHFRATHQSLYQHVEPTSVTPFAVPVRERALHALVVTLVRFWGNGEERARPSPAPRDELFDRVRGAVLDRVARVDRDETAETEAMLDQIISEWRRIPPQRYGDFRPPDEEVPLMYPWGSQRLPSWLDRSLATPTSMRNVDAACDARPVAVYPTVSEGS